MIGFLKTIKIPHTNKHYHAVNVGAVFCLIAIIVIVYSNSLNIPFVLDDLPSIQDSPSIRLTKLSFNGLIEAASNHYYSSRPLACISLALNFYFDGENPYYYHFVNIGLHVLTGLLLYVFVKHTLLLNNTQPRRGIFNSGKKSLQTFGNKTFSSSEIILSSFFVSALWAVHPIQSQAVNYVVQRMTILATLFYILSLTLYLKGRLSKKKITRHGLFVSSAASGLLALSSKEIALTLPFIIVLYEWCFFQQLSIEWLKNKATIAFGILFVFSVIVFCFWGDSIVAGISTKYAIRDFTMLQRVLTEFRVVMHYLSLMLFPHPDRLNLDYLFPLSYSLFSPLSTFLSFLSIITMTLFAVWAALKKNKMVAFCIFWFLGNLVIESSIIALEIIFEHRMYLPSIGVIFLLVYGVFRFIQNQKLRVVFLSIIVVICSVWTYQRNEIWTNDETLWADCVKKSPQKARPHNNYGFALLNKGKYEKAIDHLRIALELDPNLTDAYINMGTALAGQNNLLESVRYLQIAVSIEPYNTKAHVNLGTAFMRQRNLPLAITHLQKAISINPDLSKVHNDLGVLLAKQGHVAEAFEHYNKAVTIDPQYAKAHNNLANLFFRTRQINDAIRHYDKALALNPESAKAHNNLGSALMAAGSVDRAIAEFKNALRLDPAYEKARYNLERAQAVR